MGWSMPCDVQQVLKVQPAKPAAAGRDDAAGLALGHKGHAKAAALALVETQEAHAPTAAAGPSAFQQQTPWAMLPPAEQTNSAGKSAAQYTVPNVPAVSTPAALHAQQLANRFAIRAGRHAADPTSGIRSCALPVVGMDATNQKHCRVYGSKGC